MASMMISQDGSMPAAQADALLQLALDALPPGEP